MRAEASGDVGVRLCREIRIYAQRDACALARELCALCEQLHLRLALDVKEQDASVECCVHLFGGLAHAGEDDAACDLRAARSEDACKFAAGDDVETAALRCQQ